MSPPDDEMDLPPRGIPPTISPTLVWWYKWWRAITTIVVIGFVTTAVGVWSPPFDAVVVNMIPAQIDHDELPNPEPSIAVNPANPDEIVAGGLWEGMQTAGCGRTSFGVSYSQDRGKTWTLHCTLELGTDYLMGDPSFAFTSDGSSLLVAAQAAYRYEDKMLLRIFSTHTDALAMSWPVTDLIPASDVSLDSSHMPWIAAGTSPSTPLVAIGGDSYYTDGTDCHSGVVWWNYPTPSNYAPVCVSPRAAPYTPVVRTAVAGDGTAYAATYRIVEYTGPTSRADGANMDVVVFRHDPTEPSEGTTDAFSGLKEADTPAGPCDSKDGLRGVRVVQCVHVPFEEISAGEPGFGYELRRFSHVAIAVDPAKSSHVFVAWGDAPSRPDGMTLHIRESSDGGQTWSSTDRYTVGKALNPGLAVSTSGHLGFSYQQLMPYTGGDRWETNVQIFDASDVGAGAIQTFTLASMPSGNPMPCAMPYMGDYMDLKAINDDFYGVFSSTSDMSASNFPLGVTYARTPTVAQLAKCPDATPQPETSIDPYFFRIDRHQFSYRNLPRFARSVVAELKRSFSSIFK